MNAEEAFAEFVKRVLTPNKARRYAALASSKKGQRKILDGLCHDFEPAIRPTAIHSKNYDNLWAQPCFSFHASIGFGVEFPNVRSAYNQLSVEDSWLIILRDASAGIHRPEAYWDHEKLIA
jgi:hypothetical protein